MGEKLPTPGPLRASSLWGSITNPVKWFQGPLSHTEGHELDREGEEAKPLPR